jgi:hypothetical protein
MLGERPVNQLLPAVRWMREQHGAARWRIVGNDYVFPRVTGSTSREALGGTGSQIVGETYVPLGTSDFRPVLREMKRRDREYVGLLYAGLVLTVAANDWSEVMTHRTRSRNGSRSTTSRRSRFSITTASRVY